MKFSSLLSLASITLASAKNILLTNDDGWAATPIRATYNALTKQGHNVILVAPVEQRSGFGGTFTFPSDNVLAHDDQFHFKKEGDPAWGHDELDDHIWYFNATPAACVAFAFDYLLPNYFADLPIDLVVSGPNEGQNLDIPMFTVSGTIGATYNAVYRGHPAIAFSGANGNNSFYQDTLNDDPQDVQNIYAAKIVELVETIFTSAGDNARVLPLSVGLNVNFPPVSTDSKIDCYDPQYVFSRLTGEKVQIPALAYNSTSNTFAWSYKDGSDATGNGLNGDVTLPSEDLVVTSGCFSAVSAFSVDYSAPLLQQAEVKGLISGLLVDL
jgi:5'-nucleotidase